MRILLNACKTFIRDSGPFIKKYYKKADMVWRCLTMFDSVRMCPTMIDMSCSAKHFDPLQAAPLMKQNFLLPRCQWHLHQQHWRRHLPRNSAFTVPRWKCDMWPKTCSTGVLMSSDELWSYWSFMHIYAWLCMHHAPSLVSSLPTIWPSVTLWSAEESTTEPKAESTRGSATVLVSSAGAGETSAAKGAKCVSGKLKAPWVKQVCRKSSTIQWLDMAWLRRMKTHKVQLHCHEVTLNTICLELMRTLLNACKTFITVHHNTSQCHVKRGCAHKKADMVWRCLTMFDGVECVRMCLTNVWHDLLSQALWSSAGGTIDEAELSAAPLPVTSASTALASTPPAKLCVHSAKVKVWHVIQNLLDWCSHVFIAASTWMNNNAKKKPFNQRIINVSYAFLCICLHDYCIMLLLWSPIESAHNLAFSDSLVGRRIHYRTQSRIHTGLCDSACLQRWCRC